MEQMSRALYGAIDIGTGSVRAGLFTSKGEKECYAEQTIETRNHADGCYEQSSENIWRAVVHCLRTVTSAATASDRPRSHVAAIGIDATCSLVACLPDENLSPLPVSNDASRNTGEDEDDVYNILLWLDCRAKSEAAEISSHEHPAVRTAVKHFGGTVSPEGELAKLLWLSRHNEDTFSRAVFFDLADWLAAKLAGTANVRSVCTLACKWGWAASRDSGWDADFWSSLGLPTLSENKYAKIAPDVVYPASIFGTVSAKVASDIGLSTNTVVAAPVVDAYAGAVWSLSVPSKIGNACSEPNERLSMVAGTSTCFLQFSDKPVFVNGVWGPFKDALVPGMHVTEGGQSVTGKLLQSTVEQHPAYKSIVERVGKENVFGELSRMTDEVVQNGGDDPASDTHCLDYHVGNRSPLADPGLRGSLVGLTLADNEWDLAVRFRATTQALCYGARHIVEEMRKNELNMKVITACGGLCKSRLFLTELADCLGLPVILSKEEDTVLLGGAILAKEASSNAEEKSGSGSALNSIVKTAMEMCKIEEVVLPNEKRKDFHDRKYKVYRKMHHDSLEYRRIMKGE